MDINAYLKPLLKWWRLLLIATVIAVVGSSLSVFLQPDQYISKTTLMIGRNAILNSNPDSGQIYVASQLAAIYADMASREPIQVKTMQALDTTWLPYYQASVIPNTQLIEISVTDTDAKRAQVVADELANQLISQSPTTGSPEDLQRQEFIKQQLASLQAQIKDSEARIEQLQKDLAGLNSASQVANAQKEIDQLNVKLTDLRTSYTTLLTNSQQGALNILSVVEPANLPSHPVGTNKGIIVILAALVGFGLAAAAAYLLEYIDRTIKTTTDVERVLHYPVIGYLSEIDSDGNNATYVLNNPNSAMAESFRLLKSNLDFYGLDKASKTILITSPSQGNGKTTIAVNLALAMSQGDQKTVLVDADLRRPAVHTALNLAVKPGLAEIVRGDRSALEAIRIWKKNKLEVITAGGRLPNVTEIAGSKRISSILNDLKDTFEVIIVDAPPLVISDAYSLASKVDGVILIMVPGQTREEQAKVMKDQLERAGAKVIGVVFNKISLAHANSEGDYQYLSMYSPNYYSDYVSHSKGETAPETGQSKKLLAFFEHGELPSEVAASVEKAVTAIKTQPRNLAGKIRKTPKQE
jgi:polysaccharide biosynthesis transport protein